MITMVANGKKERKTILAGIKESVLKSPKSMYELAKELGSNWDTVRNNVNLLQDLGIVAVQESKVVYVQHANCTTRADTIAGLPVSEDTKKKVHAIAKKFYVEWKKQNDKEPNKTILQKAMVEIADTFPELKIPRGWYFYGKIIFVKVSPEEIGKVKYDYDLKKSVSDMTKLESKIKDIVERYSRMSTQQIVQEQYQKYENKLYLLKRKIEQDLLFGEDLKQDIENLSKTLYEMVFTFDLRSDDDLSAEVYALMKDVVTIIILKLHDKEFMRKKDCKVILYDVFTTLWRLLATYNLYATMEGEFGYDPAVIKSFFVEKLSAYQADFLDQLQNLGFIPA